jgi:hypothetical protein
MLAGPRAGLLLGMVKEFEFARAQVGRGWRAELGASKRQATHRTNMLLELTRDSTFNRPVARVMRTRRKLIDNNAIGGDEHFDAHHTDDIQAVQDTLSKGRRACLKFRRCAWSRDKRCVQNVICVNVLNEGIESNISSGITRTDNRTFPQKRDQCLENAWDTAKRCKRSGCFGSVMHKLLAFAIVAALRSFQDARIRSAIKVTWLMDNGILRNRDPRINQRRLLADTVLGGVEHSTRWMNGNMLRCDRRCSG